MEFFLAGVFLVILVGGYFWQRKRCRDIAPVEDDWAGIPGTAGRPTEILTRDALTSRSRTTDLDEWDDTADAPRPPKPKPAERARPKPGAPRPAATPADAGPAPVLDRNLLKGRPRSDAPLEWPED
jgi:hypothetical protein